MASRFKSGSVEITEGVGEVLGHELGAGCLVCLSGELGSGKTALVRGLARGLGVEDVPGSPSFALMNEYAGRVPLYHFDAWMRGREAALLSEGAGEYLDGPGVAVIEWAERVGELLPRPHLLVRLGHLGPEERSIELALVEVETPGQGARSARECLLRAKTAAEGASGLVELGSEAPR